VEVPITGLLSLSVCVYCSVGVISEQFSRSELAGQVPVSTGLYIG
jgi:hypothetical protein